MNMHIVRLSIVLSSSLLLLGACGNRDDLMLPSESPPEDARRYLIKPRPAEAAPEPAPESGDDDG